MAKKGEFVEPRIPLSQAVECAMDAIAVYEVDTALFFVAGKVTATKCTSDSYARNLDRLAGNLIGVYNVGIDARQLREDIGMFYREAT